MKYKEYLKSKDWSIKRKEKLDRKSGTKNRCAICASTERVEIHHLVYKDLFNVEQSDLRVLCHRCHFFVHDLINAGKIIFKGNSHNSRFATIKNCVKKELGISKINCFYPDI
mgnify:CR=1 FL=1